MEREGPKKVEAIHMDVGDVCLMIMMPQSALEIVVCLRASPKPVDPAVFLNY